MEGGSPRGSEIGNEYERWALPRLLRGAGAGPRHGVRQMVGRLAVGPNAKITLIDKDQRWTVETR